MKTNSTSGIRRIYALLIVFIALTSTAQTYTYKAESFEEAAWDKKGASVIASTGKWETNNNVRSNAQALQGSYSLLFAKKAGIVFPELTEGAGTLIYHCHASNRTVNVEVSADKVNWTTVETYKETSVWAKHVVEINDRNVRYVRMTTTSNNNFYIDDVIITKTDGTDGDGQQVVTNLSIPYFLNDFETSANYPSSKDEASKECIYNVTGQGEWKYYKAYRGTNESYIADGSKCSLRMLKSGGYVITPVLLQGVVKVEFDEGRTNKDLTIYTSKDGGDTWTELKEIRTTEHNVLNIYDRDVNRIKIANPTTRGDVDLDNLTVSAYPEGTPGSVTTVGVSNITPSSAVVSGKITAKGDKEITEWGVCWSYANEKPSVADNVVKAESEDYAVMLTGLQAGTVVYCRAYVAGFGGVGYGDVIKFTTSAATVPVIATAAIVEDSYTDEKLFYAIAGGKVLDTGGETITEAGVEYGETESLSDATRTRAQIKDGEFKVSLGLKANTTYYVRAYAVNAVGTAYGETVKYVSGTVVVPDYPHNVYYVDPAGDDAIADGSLSKPFYSLQKAVDKVVPGDTIYMNAGTYNYKTRINIGIIGKPNSGMIALHARGGRAILDFSSMALADGNQGVRLTGSYWHFYGLDIAGAGDNGLLIERNKVSGGDYSDIANNTAEGHDNIIEYCNFYRNRDTGLQMKNLAEYNKVINCDAYFNADPDMGDADGFAVKISHGTGNYFYGCRAWNNSDDGWDQFIKKEGGFPDDVTTTLEYCWAFNNGFLEDGSEGEGNGNGFKMGSDEGRNNIIMNRCLAFNNLQKGFDQNHNTGSMILNNCTGYSAKYTANKSHYTYRLDESVASGKEIRFTNCVAVSDGISDRNDSKYAPYSIKGEQITCDFNTLPADYRSIDPTGSDAPRNADGSLPVLDFMRIAEGNTKLIDKGTPVEPYEGETRGAEGIIYNGVAPDLGCYEYTSPTGIHSVSVSTHSNDNIRVSATKDGIIIVTAEGVEPTDEQRLNIYDINGTKLASKLFNGTTTAIALPTTRGMLLVNVVGNGVNRSVKVLVR